MSIEIQKCIELGKNFIRTQGRDFEKALLNYYFDDYPRRPILDALVFYQNKDGGFGKALEPDLRYPGSSVLCTTEALQILGRVGLDSQNPMVWKAVLYLVDHYQPATQCWNFVPPEVEQFARAPWWNFNPDSRSARHNPRAEILGVLLRAPELVPDSLLKEVTKDVEATLMAEWESLKMHDVLCYLRLSRCDVLPDSLENVMQILLPRMIQKTVAFSPEAWSGYNLRPYQVVEGMEDPLLPLVADGMSGALRYLITEQEADGSWPLTWNWVDTYPEAWLQAEKEWRSRVTFEHLLTLKNFEPMVSS